MSKQQRTVLIVAGGALALYLLYRWYQGRQAGTASTTTPNTSSTDYAALAGQEQADAAALQGQNSQLAATEQSDVAALTGSLGTLSAQQQAALGGLGAQEQSDVSGLTGQVSSLTTGLENLANQFAGLSTQPQNTASVAMGATPTNRATINTHKGGPFYNYYVKVTGHAPPGNVSATNWIYSAWRAGVSATRLQQHPPHPSAPKQRTVAHPNPTHTQQTNTLHKLPAAKKPPPKAHKPRVSGKRR